MNGKAIVLISFGLAGCFHPRFSNGTLTCAHSTDCPPGYHCALNLTCYQPGSDPDPGLDPANGDAGVVQSDATSPPEEGQCAEVARPPAHAQAVCKEGKWQYSCEAGFRSCDDRCIAKEQCCTVLDCPAVAEGNGTPVCESGSCGVHCAQGRSLCQDSCLNLQDDFNNCGACGRVCGQNEYCAAGDCHPNLSVALCGPGTKRCGSGCIPEESCCTASDCPAVAMAAGEALCEAGTCSARCNPGYTLCGSLCINLSNDKSHCGSCFHRCGDSMICYQSDCIIPIQ